MLTVYVPTPPFVFAPKATTVVPEAVAPPVITEPIPIYPAETFVTVKVFPDMLAVPLKPDTFVSVKRTVDWVPVARPENMFPIMSLGQITSFVIPLVGNGVALKVNVVAVFEAIWMDTPPAAPDAAVTAPLMFNMYPAH